MLKTSFVNEIILSAKNGSRTIITIAVTISFGTKVKVIS